MKNNIKMNKSALSKMLAIAIIIIVVIVVVAGAYYYSTTLNPSTNPSPSPSATPSATPAQTTTPSSTAAPSASPTVAPSASQSPTTSPTAQPSPSTQPIANFRAGAYANYTIKTYDKVTGNETSNMPMNWQITEGTANGTNVWVVTMSTTVTSDNVTMDSFIIMNIDKTTYKPVSGQMKVISDGITILDQTIDLSSPQYNATASAIDPNTIIGTESITVAAGTFNCQKATTTDSTTGAVNNVWLNSNIPVWGIVKMTTTEGTVVTSITELIAYG